MSNFNYYLNRQGSIGRQGAKGEKGDTGYSPYIDIKSNTPTEFIMTIHNETESFDTPNLIPTAIGEKVTEMDAVLTTHTEDIANLKLDITTIENKNTAQDSDIAALKTRVGGTEESIEDLNHKYTVLGGEVSDLTLTKQNKLVEGANITLTDNADGTTTISASGGGGGGGSDVPIATTSTAGKVKPDGTTITITDDGTISAVGGGSSEPPANMVTTDTTQTITGFKTFTNNLRVNAPIASRGIDIRCTNDSPVTQGLTIFNEDMSGRIFNISVNDAGQANISGTTLNIGDVSLNTYVSGRNINMTTGDTGNLVVNTNNPIKVHNKTANTDDIVLVQGNIKAGDNVSLTKDTTTGDITISSTGGGGEAPANMVTTDTDQDITGVKRFLSNRQDLSKPAIKIGSYAAGQDTYDGGYITSGSGVLEIGSYYATNSKGGFLNINSTANSSIFKITSDNSNINPRLQLGTYNYEGEIYNDIAEGLCLSNHKYNYGYPRSILKVKDNTLTFTKTDGTVVDLLNNSSKEQYGIRADYALTHGIVDNPNGIISYNATDKVITVRQGLVLSCAGSNNTAKTIINGDMQHTVTSTGEFTLFYANGELLECGKVDYSTEEPSTNNGVTNYQAWFNPDKTVNTNQQWQFKSNDTGNVWRYVDNSTPLADFVASSTTITSVSYLGYRVFNDDVFAHKSEWAYVNKQLLNNVERTKENITVDLSDSLPNDGATYDVLFSSQAQPVNEKNKFVAVFPSNGEISPALRVTQGRVAVAGVDAVAYGAFLLPITSSRSMLLGGSSSSNNGGVISLWMHAYKKIG